jgi:hypothetical protein
MKNCPENIAALFRFLVEHHEYNKKIQEDDIKMTLDSCGSVDHRALLLLRRIVDTQSQPNLEHTKIFFEHIARSEGALASFTSFSKFLNPKPVANRDLFEALKTIVPHGQPKPNNGWGDKTSALFIRNLALIADSPTLSTLFWPDLNVWNTQTIRLPVDKVILAIFERMMKNNPEKSQRPTSFKSINKYLLTTLGCTNQEMLVWDDLWFWGFITQRSVPGTSERQPVWNPAKYWSIFTAPKDLESIGKIEQLAKQFIQLSAPMPAK